MRWRAIAAAALCSLLVGGGAQAKKKRPAPSHGKHTSIAQPVPDDPQPVADVPAAVPSKSPPRADPIRPGAAGARDVVQRESRIEFDERMVQGQTASGAIYLFQRGDSEFRSMVEMPSSFKDRTVRELLPNREKQ